MSSCSINRSKGGKKDPEEVLWLIATAIWRACKWTGQADICPDLRPTDLLDGLKSQCQRFLLSTKPGREAEVTTQRMRSMSVMTALSIP